MNYKEAVALARAKEERGFGYLYANTHKSKYYLALQYTKNEEMAKDVLQEAYLKAFTNLDKLQQPEAFPGWFGTIVANTAKNMLAKKTPMLFSDVAVEEDDESFEYQITDDTIEYQPEISYTKKETQELVHVLIDSLSDEQRFCILMFHIEGASISEIASAMNCSENTVKSRLNYGRKNLKAKAEELQKKGYQLYSIAPLPLLLLLLRSEEHALNADGTLMAAGNEIIDKVFDQILYHVPNPNNTPASEYPQHQNEPKATSNPGYSQYPNVPGNTQNPEYLQHQNTPENWNGIGNQTGVQNPAGGIKAANKIGFLQTTASKIATIAIAGICVIGGIVYYQNTQPEPIDNQLVKQEDFNQENTIDSAKDIVAPTANTTTATEDTAAPTANTTTATEDTAAPTEAIPTPTKEVNTEKKVTKDDYPSLVKGNLTKDELEFVLAYGPEEIPAQGFQNSDYMYIVNQLCTSGNYIKDYGYDLAKDAHSYSRKDVNRLFYSFTDLQFTKNNASEYGFMVDSDKLIFSPATLSYETTVDITSATCTTDEMNVYFNYKKKSYELGTTSYKKHAVLLPTADGMYRISKIEIVPDDAKTSSTPKSNSKASKDVKKTKSIKDIYKGVLQSVQKKKSGYEFSKYRKNFS